jgi:type VI protein secretion system component VasF
MSKEKARRRAEERAKKNAPKARQAEKPAPAASAPKKKAVQRSAREQRRRRRVWLIGGIWLAANAVIWIVSGAGNWEAKWLGLTLTTILVPLVVWLVWDPEGRVDL